MAIRPLLVVATLLLAGCGAQQGGDAGGAGGGVPDGSYLSTSVTEAGADRPLVAGTSVRLTVEGDRIGFSAGCNIFSGTASWDGDRLTLTGLGGTEMGCQPALEAQDVWLRGLFAGPVTLAPGDGGLVLTAQATVVTFGPQGEPRAPLAGTRWVLDSLGEAGGDDAAVSSVPAGVVAWLQISDGALSLDTGCNSGGGSVRVTDGTLEVGDLGITQIGCAGPRADVERRMLAVLQGSVPYRLDGARLTLTGADGSTLGFRAAAGGGAAPSPDPGELIGPEWRLAGIVETAGGTTSTRALPDGTSATLRVTDTTLRVNAGCNVGSAPVTVTGDTLRVGRLALTKRACREDVGSVEAAIVRVLSSGPVGWSVAGDRLRLVSADGTLELVYLAG